MRKIKQLEKQLDSLSNELQKCREEALSYSYGLMFLSKFNPETLYSKKLKKELLEEEIVVSCPFTFYFQRDTKESPYKKIQDVLKSPESFDLSVVADVVKQIKETVKKDNFIRENANVIKTKSVDTTPVCEE